MKINCIVIDDEHLARTLLDDYIGKLPSLKLIANCSSALQALEILQNKPVDLIFLDIQMPDLSGIVFLKSLKYKPVVIFTTAYPEYALDGYALDVIDYLLKPISFERFMQSVNKAAEQIKLIKGISTNKEKKYITLKSEHRIHKVKYNNILFIEGMKEYVVFHLKEGKRIITLERMKNLEEHLPDNFLRIHRSYIINKNDIRSLYGNSVEIGNHKIDIGKTYKEKVISQLFM